MNKKHLMTKCGLTLSTSQYGFDFSGVGAEWFYSWQSGVYSFKHAAVSLLNYCMLTLIFIFNSFDKT
ncbi:MAG: DUF2165 family protein [Francisellaceae bacterium]|nr:DUF2165 family protein [Francisellaceae bacterium]MBT6538474.1 DUF2165 family protein [Francisellaceae bacterium]